MSNGQNQSAGIQIRTLLTQSGDAKIVMTLPDNMTLLIDPDAGAEIALNLLSASYAARGEHALWQYCTDHDIDPATVIRIERS